MTSYSDISQAALAWAAKGLRVLPLTWPISDTQCSCGKVDCKSIGKHPIAELTRHGLKQATTDPETISMWWQVFPEANVAVVTGGGVVVIDEDKPGALVRWAADRVLPDTLQVQTGKGTHHYYRIDGAVKNRVAIAPGIDIRGDHGYVVAPPSLHYTGVLYEVSEDREIAQCPEWLRELLQPPVPVPAPQRGIIVRGASGSDGARLQVYAQRTLASCCAQVSSAPEGTRNHCLNTNAFLVGTVLGATWPHGLTRSECERDLLSAGMRAGLSEREAVRTIKSGLDAGVKRPRAVPVSRDDLATYVKHTAQVAAQRVEEQAEPEVDHAQAMETRRELMETLARDEKGKIVKSVSNLYRVLQGEPLLQGCIVYNAFARCVCSLRELPAAQGLHSAETFFRGRPWRDVDDTRLKVWLQDTYGAGWAIEDITKAVALVGDTRHWHPIRERLEAIEWHGEQLLDRWLIDYLGADDTAYTRAVSRKWLVSAVARVYEPGCKAECMLVLEGEQGIGKSTAIKVMALDAAWYSDAELQLDDPAQSAQALHGKLLVEVPELASLSKAQVETIKAYLSRQVDHYRAPYERRPESIPRQSIFAGTTNDTEYLKDHTGNRRFWPVRCCPASGRADTTGLQAIAEQLWAEARHAYQMGETWWLDDSDYDAAEEAKAAQASRIEQDPWADLLRAELLSQGLTYYLTEDVAACLGIDPSKLDPRVGKRFGAVLTTLGLVKRKITHKGQRRYAYVQLSTLGGTVQPAATHSQKEGGTAQKPSDSEASPVPVHPSYPSIYIKEKKDIKARARGEGEREKVLGGKGGLVLVHDAKTTESQAFVPSTDTLDMGWTDPRQGGGQGGQGGQEEGHGMPDLDLDVDVDPDTLIWVEEKLGQDPDVCPYNPRDPRYVVWHRLRGLKGGKK